MTSALLMALAMGGYAQQGGGLFAKGFVSEEAMDNEGPRPILPQQHGMLIDQNADSGPVGSGIAVLIGLGAAYAFARKRKEA